MSEACPHCGGDHTPMETRITELERQLAAAREFIAKRFAAHRECEDCWYSCPKHPHYCGEENRDKCWCGKDEADALLNPAGGNR
jgi:hypothetical protein